MRRGRGGRGVMRARETDTALSRKLSTWSTVLVRKAGRKAGHIPSEYPASSFAVAVVAVVVGWLRENSAPLQLTIAIKIPPWAPPPYELRTLAGRLTFATLRRWERESREETKEAKDLVSTGDKRSMLQRARISFREGDDGCIGIKGMSAAARLRWFRKNRTVVCADNDGCFYRLMR